MPETGVMTEVGDGALDAEQQSEYERLVCLDRTFNPTAWQMLSTAGVRAGWRVADVTPSSGRLASELAAAGMDVAGLDRDTRLAEHSDEHGQVQWSQVDSTRDDNPAVVGPGFDAIHARTMLGHLPRRTMRQRWISWLKPGGWLLVGDAVWLSPWSPSQQYTAALRALLRASQTFAAGPKGGWKLPTEMHRGGLHRIDSTIVVPTVRGGEPWAEFWARTMRQWQHAMVPYGTPYEMTDIAIKQLYQPATVEAALGLVYTLGQRPYHDPEREPDTK